MTFSEINALGQIIDTTWGHTSTAMPGHSVKVTLAGDQLCITYTMVCTFASEHAMSEQARSYEKDADQIIQKLATKIKGDFRESTGRGLKMRESRKPDSSFEIISVQSHVSPKRTALYRRHHFLTVE